MNYEDTPLSFINLIPVGFPHSAHAGTEPWIFYRESLLPEFSGLWGNFAFRIHSEGSTSAVLMVLRAYNIAL